MRNCFTASLALVACVFLLVPAGSSRAQPMRADPAQDQFDFGSVKQGTSIRHEFAIRNTGSAALRFSGAELSMPGMKSRFAPAEIAPGAEGTMTLEWTT